MYFKKFDRIIYEIDCKSCLKTDEVRHLILFGQLSNDFYSEIFPSKLYDLLENFHNENDNYCEFCGKRNSLYFFNIEINEIPFGNFTKFVPTLVKIEKSEKFEDIDGNIYNTIKIGSQIWMAENLKVTKFKNGDKIDEIKLNNNELDDSDYNIWEYLGLDELPACNFFNKSEKNIEKFGLLYNWYSVKDKRGLAPEGWHIPSESEWTSLIRNIGGLDYGNKLKSNEYWESGLEGNNIIGFNGFPGGFITPNGYYDRSSNQEGYWWSSDSVKVHYDLENKFALAIKLNESQYISKITKEKNYGFSIRCIKNIK